MSFHGSCESVAVPLLEHTALDHLIKLLTANPRFHDAFCSWFWLLRALGDTSISGKSHLCIARHCAHFVNQCRDSCAVRRLFTCFSCALQSGLQVSAIHWTLLIICIRMTTLSPIESSPTKLLHTLPHWRPYTACHSEH